MTIWQGDYLRRTSMDYKAILEKQIQILVEVNDKLMGHDNFFGASEEIRENAQVIAILIDEISPPASDDSKEG